MGLGMLIRLFSTFALIFLIDRVVAEPYLSPAPTLYGCGNNTGMIGTLKKPWLTPEDAVRQYGTEIVSKYPEFTHWWYTDLSQYYKHCEADNNLPPPERNGLTEFMNVFEGCEYFDGAGNFFRLGDGTLLLNPITQKFGTKKYCRTNCGAGEKWDGYANGGRGACVSVSDVDRRGARPPNLGSCPVGNPVYPLTGTKVQRVNLGVVTGWSEASANYASALAAWTNPGGEAYMQGDMTGVGGFGRLWWSSLERRILVSVNGKAMKVTRGDGSAVDLVFSGGQWRTQVDNRSAAQEYRDAVEVVGAGGWRYRDQGNQSLEVYGSGGQMSSWARNSGMVLMASWPSSTLWRLTDPFGRKVEVIYKSLTTDSYVQLVIDRLRDATGREVVFGYDAPSRLRKYPTGAASLLTQGLVFR
ncbi:MAG: hypothetical protein IIA02_12730 [Proteobacteria bacterium]|nr:hypothetical protein [Pseudomonadota bacterium]